MVMGIEWIAQLCPIETAKMGIYVFYKRLHVTKVYIECLTIAWIIMASLKWIGQLFSDIY